MSRSKYRQKRRLICKDHTNNCTGSIGYRCIPSSKIHLGAATKHRNSWGEQHCTVRITKHKQRLSQHTHALNVHLRHFLDPPRQHLVVNSSPKTHEYPLSNFLPLAHLRVPLYQSLGICTTFFLAICNESISHRSAALLPEIYGPSFYLHEFLPVANFFSAVFVLVKTLIILFLKEV